MFNERHQNLIQNALAKLVEHVPGLEADFEDLEADFAPIATRRVRVDGYLRLRRPRLGAFETLAVEIKPAVTTAGLPNIINKIRQLETPCVLVTDYLPPGTANLLKKKGIFFFDTAGNAYLDLEKMLVVVAGQKPAEPVRRAPLAAFGDAGVRLIFTLLAAPDVLDQPYRRIAAAADVAQGTITHVLQDLEELGFFQKVGRKRILRDRLALAERWTEAYVERLRPKLILGRFDTPDPQWWKKVRPVEANWGGEPAGALLTDHLRPQTYTIYLANRPEVPGRLARFVAENGLRKNPAGTVEILNAFWDPDIVKPTGNGTVHPLLAYADLMATQDGRCLETGKIIHDELLAPAFRD